MRTTCLPKLYTAALTAALAAAVIVPAAASAAPAVDRAFNLPGTPRQLALGPDGNVWVTMDGLTDNIARVRPDGTVDSFTAAAISSPIGIVAGPDGQLWVTETGAVAHFSPSDPSAARRVDVPGLSPNRIVVGSDGNLWTGSGDSVVRIGTDERFVAVRPTGLQGARGIAAGGDGNLYVADFLGRQVVGITTAGASAGQFPVDDAPQELAAGPSNQLAVTIPSNLIERVTPPSSTVQRTDVPLTDPTGIVFAPDGAWWAANFPRDTLTRLTPDGTVTTLAGFPRSSGPRHLVVGRDGTLWVGLETTRQIARVTGVVAPATGGGGGGGTTPPPPDTTAPVVSNVSAPATLRVGRSGTLHLTLSEAATVSIRFERVLPGRRTARGRCVTQRRHASHGRRCRRLKAIGTQARSAAAGANALAIGGKLGRRTLPAGRYRLTIVARDAAGNASAPVRRTLTVTSRRPAARHR
jgi:streptogramin lyase